MMSPALSPLLDLIVRGLAASVRISHGIPLIGRVKISGRGGILNGMVGVTVSVVWPLMRVKFCLIFKSSADIASKVITSLIVVVTIDQVMNSGNRCLLLNNNIASQILTSETE